jgi:hypothetical protein
VRQPENMKNAKKYARSIEILLISNYLPDAQQSVIRYAQMLQSPLTTCGYSVKIVHPLVVFGSIRFLRGSLAKWIAYVDEFNVSGLHRKEAACGHLS